MNSINNDERLARLALYLGLNINPAPFHRVVRHLGSALDGLSGHDLRHIGVNLTPLMSGGLMEEALDHLKYAQSRDLEILIWGDENYPERLLEIDDPPPVLWMRGRLCPGDRYAVALVGSRKATAGGLSAARRLGREGAEMGLTIISGLAKGVDGEAHRGALEAGGRTVAVLGCGLNHVYPRENAGLYRDIVKSGAIVSEFPPAYEPLAINFPRRNRVIAGLALSTVVVEAPERSGSLITARLALEMGREVAALPGPAGSNQAAGAHKLIKNGAALVENMREVAAEIRPRLLEGLRPPKNPLPMEVAEAERAAVREKSIAPRPRAARAAPAKAVSAAPAAPPAAPAPAAPPPDTAEGRLLAHLQTGAKDVDALTRAAETSAQEMAVLLFNMEIGGLVRRLASGLYEKI